jgi:hypothetical protein
MYDKIEQARIEMGVCLGENYQMAGVSVKYSLLV